jgi:hypothetical protein
MRDIWHLVVSAAISDRFHRVFISHVCLFVCRSTSERTVHDPTVLREPDSRLTTTVQVYNFGHLCRGGCAS